MENWKIVETIKKSIWIKGEEEFDSLLPKGIKIQLDSHSTATHCYIYLTLPDCDPLLIWYKTNWVSSIYEFNEREKVSGIQDGCVFAEKYIDIIVKLSQEIIADHDLKMAQEKQKEHLLADHKKKVLIDTYKSYYD